MAVVAVSVTGTGKVILRKTSRMLRMHWRSWQNRKRRRQSLKRYVCVVCFHTRQQCKLLRVLILVMLVSVGLN